MQTADLLKIENELIANGAKYICGVDEAGRGPLAGPVCVGACIPDFERIVEGVNDSKKLTEKRRESLYAELSESVFCHKTIFIEPDVIDEINILNATKLAMKEAVESMFPLPDMVLIDAVKLELPYPSRSIIHGDALSYSIAVASIFAKVERDRLMMHYAELYPEYGFEKHKGYGSAYHIEMLKKYGPCPIHRKTFIKNFFK